MILKCWLSLAMWNSVTVSNGFYMTTHRFTATSECTVTLKMKFTLHDVTVRNISISRSLTYCDIVYRELHDRLFEMSGKSVTIRRKAIPWCDKSSAFVKCGRPVH